jgi:cell division protein FtsN
MSSKEPASVPLGTEFSDARVLATEPPPAPKEKKMQTPSGRWVVQVQATTQEEAAQNLARQLREQGLAPAVSKVERQGEVWYRVRVGKFANEDEARAVVARFRREGKFSQAYPVLE